MVRGHENILMSGEGTTHDVSHALLSGPDLKHSAVVRARLLVGDVSVVDAKRCTQRNIRRLEVLVGENLNQSRPSFHKHQGCRNK